MKTDAQRRSAKVQRRSAEVHDIQAKARLWEGVLGVSDLWP
jgi:hypothetical protein